MDERQRAFYRYLSAILKDRDAGTEQDREEAESTWIQNAGWAYRQCVRLFHDRDRNLRRWLFKKPCVFRNPKTGEIIHVVIGEDYEALYCFLEFCSRLNSRKRPDDDFLDYLRYVVARSQLAQPEEC